MKLNIDSIILSQNTAMFHPSNSVFIQYYYIQLKPREEWVVTLAYRFRQTNIGHRRVKNGSGTFLENVAHGLDNDSSLTVPFFIMDLL